MGTELMYPKVNQNELMQKMFQDTSNLNFNERNSLQVQSAEIHEPKDMYKENTQAKEILQQKQEYDNFSYEKVLDIPDYFNRLLVFPAEHPHAANFLGDSNLLIKTSHLDGIKA